VSSTDTIAAIATPPGHGGIGIVRVSGPAAPAIAEALLGRLPPPRYATRARFRDADGAALDDGLALYFPAPHSYTGEQVLELHGHGGPAVLALLLERTLALGARRARPGEFSERAFLNGKLDLAQAEAVADLIASGSAAAARAAARSLAGEFSARVRALTEGLIALRTRIEAALDFPEDDGDFQTAQKIGNRIAALEAELERLQAAARQGRALRDGLTVVLAGPPNAGKSSLLNALARHDSAIVSAVPGTTRDVLREHIALDGLPLTVLDTAGLRDSGDEIETEGVRRARAAMAQADRVLLVVDDAAADDTQIAALRAQLPPEAPGTLVRNKIDLSGRAPGACGADEIALSIKTGAGLEALYAHLKAAAGYAGEGGGTFSARRRHLEALTRARGHLRAAAAQLAVHRGELAAEELRRAQNALSEIGGEFTSDDLLGRIFAEFCIGK
jgi:tRNA modification GTPase